MDEYIALGTDPRPALEIERAAKVAADGGPLYRRCAESAVACAAWHRSRCCFPGTLPPCAAQVLLLAALFGWVTYSRLPTPTRPFLLQLRGVRQLRGGAWAVQNLQLLQGSAVLRRGLPGGALEGGAHAGVQVGPG